MLPIPLFLFEEVCYELARQTWSGQDEMPPFAVRDEGALRAALAQPYQAVAGVELYDNVLSQAACLFRGLIKDHPLVDGNKRAAVTASAVYLLMNGYRMTASDDEVRNYALRVARRAGDYPVRSIRGWFRRHSRVAPWDELMKRRDFNERLYAGADLVAEWFGAGAGLSR